MNARRLYFSLDSLCNIVLAEGLYSCVTTGYFSVNLAEDLYSCFTRMIFSKFSGRYVFLYFPGYFSVNKDDTYKHFSQSPVFPRNKEFIVINNGKVSTS